MANPLECRSCGYVCHSEDLKCPYCGTPTNLGLNSKKTFQINRPTNTNYSNNNNFGNNTNNSIKDHDINVCLLVFLVIAFWPAAVIYVIVKLTQRNK